jgi:TPR repeat protein
MLHFGEGAPRDPQAAMQWYLRALGQGHAVAPNHLGRLYLNGEGVKKDVREACKWYAVSAARGDLGGQKNAAWCKSKGWAAVEK